MASIGDPLYIKSKDTRVLKQPRAGSEGIGMLQPMDKVIWLGAAPEDRAFHKIRAGNLIGFVLQQNLSTNPKPAAMEDIYKCKVCDGLGYMQFPDSLKGFEGMAVHPQCRTCNGTGQTSQFGTQAFASHGVGIKG